MELTWIATREARLSSLLRQELRMSAGLINRLKWKGALLVNGNSVHTDYPVVPGDRIVVRLDEPEPLYPAENGTLEILYEDAHLLAVDKPAGMLIHPSRATNCGTLANLVAGYYRATGQNSAFHPITRLDRDTYGIVLLAKNSHVHQLMGALHNRQQLKKTYHALVFGCPAEPAGVVEAPIARKAPPSLLREVRADGKPSRTEYTVLRRGKSCALLALRPVTGRTHQLRIHCAYMGWPILGDPQYGSPASAAFSLQLGLTTQLLCAHTLEFPHPLTGETMVLRSKMEVPQALLDVPRETT